MTMLNPYVRNDFTGERRTMVATQIAARGVQSPLVLEAMGTVPREAFVPEHLRHSAYDDSPLPIAAGQTISQPHVVAYMIGALELSGGEKVLEVGTGSGYAAAVLAQIAGKVYTMERIRELAQGARTVLEELVAAGARAVPEALKRQLRTGGRLVIPVGRTEHLQHLVRITRVSEIDFEQEDLVPVRFVPLIADADR
jgi:protein-L-isoaspartate(D-aspartate) O-methyltransferase